MDDEEFDQFLLESTESLERAQEHLKQTYQLGSWDAYAYDVPSGKLTFKDATGAVRVECDTIPLGTFATHKDTWQWAWANKSMPPEVQQKAQALQELATVTGLNIFKEPSAEIDESMAWEFAAMGVRHLQAKGCYHMPAGPQGQIIFFVALMDVRAV